MWVLFTSIIAGQGLFLAFFILVNRTRIHKELLPIGFLLLAFTMILIETILIWTNYIYYIPVLNGWYSFNFAVIGPLFLMSLRLYQGHQIKISFYLHFLLPLLLLVVNGPYIFMGWAAKQELYRNMSLIGVPELYEWRLRTSYLVATLAIWGYALFMLINEIRFRSTHKKVRHYLYFVNLFALANVMTLIINKLGFASQLYDHINIIAMAFLIYTLGYLMQANMLLTEIPAKISGRYKKSSLTPAAAESILTELRKVLVKNQSYLNPELRLSQLSHEVGTNTHFLSQVINERLQTSYSELITKYRLEHAIAMMKDDRDHRLLLKEISFKSGFNNKTSFTQAFKKATSLTPSQYRK